MKEKGEQGDGEVGKREAGQMRKGGIDLDVARHEVFEDGPHLPHKVPLAPPYGDELVFKVPCYQDIFLLKKKMMMNIMMRESLHQ